MAIHLQYQGLLDWLVQLTTTNSSHENIFDRK